MADKASAELRCPKCGSLNVQRTRNQECKCSQCGETFFFVTPTCGTQLDTERYKL